MRKPLVSIIIPTFNSEEFLKECLRSVREQTCGNIEVIVVDHYSTDMSREIAKSFGARIFESNTRRSEARNVGARRARGSLLFFVDSDMELDSSVIEQCVKKIKEGCDGVTIPELSIGKGYWAKCKGLEKTCYIGDDSMEAARFFKASVFWGMGGYDQELEAGEDWDINQRIGKVGCRIGRIQECIKHNEGRLSLRATMLKKHYYGKTLRLYRKKNPKEAKQQLRLIRPAFIRNWRRLAKDPAHALGMVFMKTCEGVAGWLGS